jgi:hypothetical protein
VVLQNSDPTVPYGKNTKVESRMVKSIPRTALNEFNINHLEGNRIQQISIRFEIRGSGPGAEVQILSTNIFNNLRAISGFAAIPLQAIEAVKTLRDQ